MRRVLRGRVVTFDDAFTVFDDGAIYVDGPVMVAVQPREAPPPPGFEAATVIPTRGTIYPGLIELHNHLPFNVLELGRFTRKYTNRDQWRDETYRAEVTGPLGLLNEDEALVASIIRFVECKSLVAGVTSTQGITLQKNPRIQSIFRGLVRNVERPLSKLFPAAVTHVADLTQAEVAKFATRLKTLKSCMLLHLAEGTDEKTRKTFLGLELPSGAWAVNDRLVGIHAVGLNAADIDTYAGLGGSIVWSPSSNLLLYGQTARIGRARAAGIPIALGADWSYSNAKNLLGELKVARAAAEAEGWPIPARELCAMVTRTPAKMLRWETLGSLEAGKRLDAVVLAGADGDPYDALIEADEADVSLVLIDGVGRAGLPSLVKKTTDGALEPLRIAGKERALALQDEASDPKVSAVTLAKARDLLEDAMAHLPELAARGRARGRRAPRWKLAFDEDLAPATLPPEERGPPKPIHAKRLDKLTIAGDATFWTRFRANGNVPDRVKDRLPGA